MFVLRDTSSRLGLMNLRMTNDTHFKEARPRREMRSSRRRYVLSPPTTVSRLDDLLQCRPIADHQG
jgi:hypothetical protein